jgi:uncharacterized membrane protein
MIDSAWTYLSIILLVAGIFPFIEQRLKWRIFNVLPSIVLTYLFVTVLSVMGFWQSSAEIETSQKLILGWLLPALMFLLLVSCDFNAILSLGPRILAGFTCAVLSIVLAIIVVYWIMQGFLPSDAWQTLASVGGGWIGGTANMVAVSQALQISPDAFSSALLVDALCYSVWVLVLFASVPLQRAFNKSTKALVMADQIAKTHIANTNQELEKKPLDIGLILLWLGIALLVGNVSSVLSEFMPKTDVLSSSAWTLLIVTVIGILASYTPLRKLSGSMTIASALLAIVVATIASKASFSGMAAAPLFILAGFMILAIHGLLLTLAARLFHFDLALCGISSLACVGGVATTPLLAAAYSPALAPVGILLAMFGYALGNGAGLIMASVLKSIGV